jgi:hypothetical protein
MPIVSGVFLKLKTTEVLRRGFSGKDAMEGVKIAEG